MKRLIIFLLGIVILMSCKPKRQEVNEPSGPLQLSMLRLDQDLFALDPDPDSIKAALPALRKKYGDFFEVYNQYVLQIGNSYDPLYPELLVTFLTDRSVFELKKATDSVFANFDPVQKNLEYGWRRFVSYFPAHRPPVLVTVISGLNQSFMATDTMLGISLDKFLGSESDLYRAAMLPLYMRRGMLPARIGPDCIRAWLTSEFPVSDSSAKLLDYMIQEGKIMYVVRQIYPDIADTLLWGFSRMQQEWCRKNEHQMWTYLVENKKLFVTDAFTIGKFINEGPFTKDFTRESPTRAAVWIGYRIVSGYMHRHPETPYEILMAKLTAREILEGARYDP